ncbi:MULTISPECIES: GNAT family N-acetyltransferase [unclassified Corynebacterium]|uniref:GNAT family N-acetyltransferase n=1 Tax=unclassified Corynebacterium TaxID=2624378 RepID=UPI00264753CF|nr:GNAT family N-acetyltransferase [Corynebacterium sp.]
MTEPNTRIKIRPAVESDIPTITAIYNDAVRTTVAVWNDEVVDEDNRLAWLRSYQQPGTRAIVAEQDGEVLGYATYGEFRHYDGFRHTVENSIYVDGTRRAGGVGTALLQALVADAREAGKHVMVAAIEGGNTASLKLHAKIGFQECGTVRQVGTKFDRWLDMTLMQIIL